MGSAGKCPPGKFLRKVIIRSRGDSEGNSRNDHWAKWGARGPGFQSRQLDAESAGERW